MTKGRKRGRAVNACSARSGSSLFIMRLPELRNGSHEVHVIQTTITTGLVNAVSYAIDYPTSEAFAPL